jgi:hypothetical protein
MKHPSFLFVILLTVMASGCNTRHSAKIFKLKNHHIAMRDDRDKWFEYVLNNTDIDFDVSSSTGRITLPSGGNWRTATQQEEDEVFEANETTIEDATVSEGEDGSVDGSGDVGGDSGDGGDGGGGE